MSRKFFYSSHNDKIHGPVSIAELQRMANEGTLKKTDRINPDNEQNWYVAGAVKGLFADTPTISASSEEHNAHPGPSPAQSSAQKPTFTESELDALATSAREAECEPSCELRPIINRTPKRRWVAGAVFLVSITILIAVAAQFTSKQRHDPTEEDIVAQLGLRTMPGGILGKTVRIAGIADSHDPVDEAERAIILGAAGSSERHFRRTRVLSLNLVQNGPYVHSDGNPITDDAALRISMVGWSSFDRHDRLPFVCKWILWATTGQIACRVQVDDERCSERLLSAAHDEWQQAFLFDGEVWNQGIQALNDVTEAWRKGLTGPPNHLDWQYLYEASRRAGPWTVTASLRDSPPIDDEGEPSSGVTIVVKWSPVNDGND